MVAQAKENTVLAAEKTLSENSIRNAMSFEAALNGEMDSLGLAI